MSNIDEIVAQKISKDVAAAAAAMEEKIKKDVKKDVLADMSIYRPIEIKVNGKKKVVTDVSHEKTETVLQYISARIPVLLVGPAGSGKTHIASSCADILSLQHFSISVNEQTSKADFLGYTDATGKIVKTNFRKAYEEGGVFIIDEIDAGNPNILTVINSALANDFCPFPDKMVKRHKDFVCVCTANTFGEGESIQYIGRNILDAATKDRFVTIFIEYSEAIERIVLPNYYDFVRELRNHFSSNNINMVVSTRGGMRLERMKSNNGLIKFNEVVDTLNLHLHMNKDAKIKTIIDKLISKETKVEEKKSEKIKTLPKTMDAVVIDEYPF